ncbi:MAG: hypothetical protein GX638_12925 [Crenarchaeota archaeon]|nr:hypothetical protein [Thermoproteota archaeon]
MKKLLILCLFTTPIYAAKYNLDSKNTAQLLCAMDMLEGEQMAETEDEKISSLYFIDGQATRKKISYCQEWNLLNRYTSNRKNNLSKLRSSQTYKKNKIGQKHIGLVLDFADNKLKSNAKLEWIKNKATNFLTCKAINVEWAKYVRGYRIVGKTIYMNVANKDKGKNLTMWQDIKNLCDKGIIK